MPTWSSSIPNAHDHLAFHLIRTPTIGALTAVVTSEDFIGCRTHYWNGRTMPCEAPNCPACNAGMPHRWHAYLACLVSKSHEHSIFECTDLAAKIFEEYRNASGTLRGCLFTASRLKPAPNSRVCLICRPANLAHILLPDPPDLVTIMSIIWQLPSSAPAIEHDYDDNKRLTFRKADLRPMREPQNLSDQVQTIGNILAKGKSQ